MRNLIAIVALGLFLAPLPSGFIRSDEKNKAEKGSIQGQWLITIIEWGEDKYTGDVGTYHITDKELEYQVRDSKRRKDRYETDESTTPCHIDVYSDDKNKVLLERGIYRLDGDTLVICLKSAELMRPTEFEADKAGRQRVLTLKRKK